MIFGAWPLRNTNPVLYTRKAADVIVDKQTGREYIRGERVLLHGKKIEIPKLIEDTEPDRWEFHYFDGQGNSDLSTNDYLREIMVGQIFRK